MTDPELFLGGVLLIVTVQATTLLVHRRIERRFSRSVEDARRVVDEMHRAVDEWNAAIDRAAAADDSGEWWKGGDQ